METSSRRPSAKYHRSVSDTSNLQYAKESSAPALTPSASKRSDTAPEKQPLRTASAPSTASSARKRPSISPVTVPKVSWPAIVMGRETSFIQGTSAPPKQPARPPKADPSRVKTSESHPIRLSWVHCLPRWDLDPDNPAAESQSPGRGDFNEATVQEAGLLEELAVSNALQKLEIVKGVKEHEGVEEDERQEADKIDIHKAEEDDRQQVGSTFPDLLISSTGVGNETDLAREVGDVGEIALEDGRGGEGIDDRQGGASCGPRIPLSPLAEFGRGRGRFGLCHAPGKRVIRDGVRWERDMSKDLKRLQRHYGVTTIVSLLSRYELRSYGIESYEASVRAVGLDFLQFPIVEMAAPDSSEDVDILVLGLIRRMKRGEVLAIHCRGGVGRAGVIAACILLRLEKHHSATAAISEVRKRRSPTAVETERQEKFVQMYARLCCQRSSERSRTSN